MAANPSYLQTLIAKILPPEMQSQDIQSKLDWLEKHRTQLEQQQQQIHQKIHSYPQMQQQFACSSDNHNYTSYRINYEREREEYIESLKPSEQKITTELQRVNELIALLDPTFSITSSSSVNTFFNSSASTSKSEEKEPEIEQSRRPWCPLI
jgi:hypothetical protein